MAEGWARRLKGGVIEPYSAGIEKHGINPLAVRAMAEAGVDISGQRSKTINELAVQQFDYVIPLCGHADETCPFFPGRKIHKGFDDPPQLAASAKNEEEALVHYRRVRDQISDFVLTLAGSLTEDKSS
jgi:arsenate reductase